MSSHISPRNASRESDIDNVFQQFLFDIERRYITLPKPERIRIEQWVKKLCDPMPNDYWKKNRNNYAKLLLHMITIKRLEEPFGHLPYDGPLKTLPSYMLADVHRQESLSPSKSRRARSVDRRRESSVNESRISSEYSRSQVSQHPTSIVQPSRYEEIIRQSRPQSSQPSPQVHQSSSYSQREPSYSQAPPQRDQGYTQPSQLSYPHSSQSARQEEPDYKSLYHQSHAHNAQYERKIKELIDQHRQELETISRVQEQEVEGLKSQLEMALVARANSEKKYREASQAHRQEIDSLNAAHDAELSALRSQLNQVLAHGRNDDHQTLSDEEFVNYLEKFDINKPPQ